MIAPHLVSTNLPSKGVLAAGLGCSSVTAAPANLLAAAAQQSQVFGPQASRMPVSESMFFYLHAYR
jgi:hypothetical protein